MARGRAHDVELLTGIAERLAPPSCAERNPHPLRYCHPLATGGPLDLSPLGLVQQHLQSLAHADESI